MTLKQEIKVYIGDQAGVTQIPCLDTFNNNSNNSRRYNGAIDIQH